MICSIQRFTERTKKDLEAVQGHEDAWVSLRKGSDEEALRSVAALPWLRRIDVTEVPTYDVSPLWKSQHLVGIRVAGAPVASLSIFSKYADLEELSISNAKTLSDTNLDALKGLVKLKSLSLYELPKITNIKAVSSLPLLEVLNLTSTSVDSVESIATLTKLRQLSLAFTKVKSSAPIAGLTNLELLEVTGAPLDSVAFVSKLTKLKSLSVSGTSFDDFSSLAALPELRTLAVSNCQKLVDFTGVSRLTKLERLLIDHTKITNLAPVLSLAHLETLALQETPIEDVSPLAKLASRGTTIFLPGKTKPESIMTLEQARPDLHLVKPRPIGR